MKLKFACSVFIALAVTGCNKSVPTCNAPETLDLVKQISDREMGNQLGIEQAKLFSYSVGAIRTQSTNGKTGAHECAADLDVIVTETGVKNILPITYTVELTDDRKEIYVNVFGLE